uniref:Uncharacterized protein n=1 Tax=Stomoxys calcitrans TaxID=35570 RepID=A0A1I8PHP4_STOCA
MELKGYTAVFLQITCVAILLHTAGGTEKSKHKPGRYVPELHGGLRGKYVPDLSGKYIHIHRPYDGGYGDRGLKYVHDAKGNIFVVKSDGSPGLLPLGSKDHLRFMVDFNYDNMGWQTVKFEWFRDGDENYQYSYENQNRIFDVKDGKDKNEVVVDMPQEPENANGSAESEEVASDKEGSGDDGSDSSNEGFNGYDYSYTERKTSANAKNLQSAIKDVLEFIEVNILPTL